MVKKRQFRKMNKKAIALETLALLILAILSFALGLIILLRSGLFSTAHTFTCTSLTSFSSFSRGIVIEALWAFFWILLAVVALIQSVLVTTSSSVPGPAGVVLSLGIPGQVANAGRAAIAVIAFGAFVIFAHAQFTNIQSAIPLISCENPEINLNFHEQCTAAGFPGDKGVAKLTFLTEVAKRSADCWNMYGQGQYDPLTGLDSPNPRTCFIINFNLNEAVTFKEMAWFMNNLKFDQKQTYLTKIGGGVILENNKDTGAFEKTIKKGTLFIKYGDHMPPQDMFIRDDWFYFKDPDCDIAIGYTSPAHKNVIDKFAGMELCEQRDEDPYNKMKGLATQEECLNSLAKARANAPNFKSNDFVYWCIKEEVTEDHLCNQFEWED